MVDFVLSLNTPFMFFHYVEVYIKNVPIWTLKGPWMAIFGQGSPNISPAGSIYGFTWGSMRFQGNPVVHFRDNTLSFLKPLLLWNYHIGYSKLLYKMNYISILAFSQ